MSKYRSVPPLAAIARNFDVQSRIAKEPGSAGHWLWSGPLNGSGYPYVGADGSNVLVARALWASEYGDLPRRLRPTCRLRACVKPDHRVPQGAGPLVPMTVAPPPRPSARAAEAGRNAARELAAMRPPTPPLYRHSVTGSQSALPMAQPSRWDSSSSRGSQP